MIGKTILFNAIIKSTVPGGNGAFYYFCRYFFLALYFSMISA